MAVNMAKQPCLISVWRRCARFSALRSAVKPPGPRGHPVPACRARSRTRAAARRCRGPGRPRRSR
eukprot:16441551-Heterocapsa_arctica.AAC.1